MVHRLTWCSMHVHGAHGGTWKGAVMLGLCARMCGANGMMLKAAMRARVPTINCGASIRAHAPSISAPGASASSSTMLQAPC